MTNPTTFPDQTWLDPKAKGPNGTLNQVVGKDADGRELVDIGYGMKMHKDVIDRMERDFDRVFGV